MDIFFSAWWDTGWAKGSFRKLLHDYKIWCKQTIPKFVLNILRSEDMSKNTFYTLCVFRVS